MYVIFKPVGQYKKGSEPRAGASPRKITFKAINKALFFCSIYQSEEALSQLCRSPYSLSYRYSFIQNAFMSGSAKCTALE